MRFKIITRHIKKGSTQMYLISNNTKLKRIHQNKARISVVKGKRHHACKMPEALGSRLGARPNEPGQYAINII
jgi:hypothetical protein